MLWLKLIHFSKSGPGYRPFPVKFSNPDVGDLSATPACGEWYSVSICVTFKDFQVISTNFQFNF